MPEATTSSASENIFTTDDDLYRAFSEQSLAAASGAGGAVQEVLRYREALWHGHDYLRGRPGFDQEYLG